MPLPQDQLQYLESSLQQHEQDLQALQHAANPDRPEIRARIEIHQMALKIGHDHAIRAVLSELCDRPELLEQLGKSPAEFLRARGFDLPPGAQVVTTHRTPQSFMFGINFRTTNGQEFSLQWEREHGVGTRILKRAS